MSFSRVYVGCAGWALRSEHAEHFPDTGTHLERYASRFSCVEINSSFYRPHQPKTYARWADSVPAEFRFAVKVPKTITHERRLIGSGPLLEQFLGEVSALGGKLGPLLVQLPPSLAYQPVVVADFFSAFRQFFRGHIVCEPRHSSWFTPEGDEALRSFEVARVAAAPPPASEADVPAGWPGLSYYRLHGSPQMYYSSYSSEYLARFARVAEAMAAKNAPVWCIFDNTAEGAATANALELLQQL